MPFSTCTKTTKNIDQVFTNYPEIPSLEDMEKIEVNLHENNDTAASVGLAKFGSWLTIKDVRLSYKAVLVLVASAILVALIYNPIM